MKNAYDLNFSYLWGNSRFALILSVFFALSCTSPAPPEEQGGTAGSYTFTGVDTISPNDDGTWTIWWTPILAGTDITYHVFEKSAEGAYNYTSPLKTTEENFVITEDLKLRGNTCYVVRVELTPGNLDDNTKEVCTNHSAYVFEGLETLRSLKDGSYILKWKAPPFKGASFQILSKKGSETDFKPLALTSESFFKTEKLSLDEIRCYVVRLSLAGFEEDTNEKSLCTLDVEGLGFDGITSVESPGPSQLKIMWENNAPNVAGYNIYFDSGFKQRIATIKDPSVTEYLVKDLLHAVVYTVGVRAFDEDGREDGNDRVVTYELANNLPMVGSVELVGTTYQNADPATYPRPETMTCKVAYEDDDKWQTLIPTFIVKNKKREIEEVVERYKIVGEPGQTEVLYTLNANDDRSDTLTCEVFIDDGFDKSVVRVSKDFLVPDTPLIASALELNALENGELEITLNRGEAEGYTDEDRDDAFKVDVSNITHGSFLTDNDNTPSDEIFVCNNGACTARFKLEQDFFTTTVDPEYGYFDFEIFSGDSSSTGQVRIFVQSRARALAFDLQVDQETPFLSKLAKERTPADGSVHPAMESKAYRDGREGLATRAFFRQPIGTSNNNGRVYLPVSPNGGSYQCSIVSNRVVCHYGEDWEGAQCRYSIQSGVNETLLAAALLDVKAKGTWVSNSFEAMSAGAAGNTISLVFDGVKAIDTVVADWNAANSANQVMYLGTDGTQVPTAGTLSLVGGKDMHELVNELHFDGTNGYLAANFDCTIPCAVDGKCDYGYIGHPSYYGTDAEFDFAVEVNEIQSNYAAIRVQVLPNLRASGYKGMTVQGQSTFTGKYSNGIGIEGLDVGFNITEVEIDGASFENLSDATIDSIDNTTLEVTFTATAPSANFAGVSKFRYRVKGSQGSENLESNWNTTEIKFYPKPNNTGVVTSAVEGRVRTLRIRNSEGYSFTESPAVSTIELNNLIRGDYLQVDGTTPISNGDVVSCSGGECTVLYTPENSFFDTGAELIKFQYRVVAVINSIQFTGANPEYQIDSFLADTDNYVLESEWASASINVRPLPTLKNMQLYVKESHETTTLDIDAKLKVRFDLDLNLTNFNTLTEEDDAFAYYHPTGLSASGVNLSALPDVGSLTAWTCHGPSVSDPERYACEAEYTPAIGHVGALTPIDYTLTINDGQYLLDLGNIISDSASLKIETRPIPKASPLAGLTVKVLENTSFASSVAAIQVAPGSDSGYTHTNSLLANGLTLTEPSSTNGSISVSGTPCDGSGICSAAYTPDLNYYGTTNLTYRVTVSDSKLGDLLSTLGQLAVLVYPRPRAQNVGTIGSPLRVTENETSEIKLDIDDQYSHALSYPCSDIEIVNVSAGLTAVTTNTVAKSCSINFTPPTDFEGAVSIDYKVKVNDANWGGEIASNEATIFLDVYPRPRTAGRYVYVLPETSNTIDLKLRLNSELGGNLDEAAASIDIDDRKGYTHRRDDQASTVNKVSEPTRGSLTVFGCVANGDCTATYTSPPYGTSSPEQFTYAVETGGIVSNQSDYFIKVLPALIPDVGRQVATIENQDITIDIKIGSGNGYDSPENDPAKRIMIVDSQNGTTLIEDLGTGSDNCSAAGLCRVTFSPTADYYNPTSASEESYIDFQLVSTTTGYSEEITSVIGRIVVKVRPKPVAIATVEDAVLQGATWQNVFAKVTDLTHPYGWSEPSITLKELKVSSPSRGTLDKLTVDCSTGVCESLGFIPEAPSGNEWYTQSGEFAQFEYKVVVEDSVLGGEIESDPVTVTLDYRPKPEISAENFIGWQGDDLTVQLAEGVSYSHPYFVDDPDQYQMSGVSITAVPNSGVEGAFLNLGSEFDCSSLVTSRPCEASFRPLTTYFYDPAGSRASVTYKVSVVDPKLGPIESNEVTSTLEIRPVVTNTGKTVYGVQSVDKAMTIGLYDGFTFPLDSLPYLPQVVIKPASTTGAGAAVGFDCTSGVCLDTFILANFSISGDQGFEYAIIQNDPDLGPKQSEWQPYAINFYPRPVARNLVTAATYFDGEQDETLTLNMVPGDSDTSTLCVPAHSSTAKTYAYEHPLCEEAVEVIVDSVSQGSFDSSPNLICDSQGKCTGDFSPNTPAVGWPGYGIAQFSYRVRIDPDVLSGEGLTGAELAALTSEPKTAQVEFFPKPYTNGLVDGGFIYAIENKDISFDISICADTAPDDCYEGYTQGYNEPADTANLSGFDKVNEVSKICTAGTCNIKLAPQLNFFTTDPNDLNELASFDYNVEVGPRTSNTTKVYYNVYPLPKAFLVTAEGIQGEDLTITLDSTAAYSHAFDLKASDIVIKQAPKSTAASGIAPGKFVVGGFVVEETGDMTNVFTCNAAGVCTATFRSIGTSGINSFIFEILVDGPADMPAATKDLLRSEPTSVNITIHPKPIAEDLEIVVLENEAGAPQLSRLFRVSDSFGYTHLTGKPANGLHFVQGSSTGAVLDFDDAKLEGVFSCASGTEQCSLGCTGGNCDASILPDTDFVSTIPTTSSCLDSGASCPYLDFGVTIAIDTAAGLYATSDNNAKLLFNVRPRPKASAANLDAYIAEEGEAVTIDFSNGSGYSHPYYDAKQIAPDPVANGALGAFDCTISSNTVCRGVYTPSGTFDPSPGNDTEVIEYQVRVHDPVAYANGNLGGAASPVGDIVSTDKGSFSIQYRPFPDALDIEAVAVQDDTNRSVIITQGNGYTHNFSVPLTKVIIKANSVRNMALSPDCNGVDFSNADCVVVCSAGSCEIEYQLTANYHGTDAGFDFDVETVDAAFSPDRNMRSQTVATFDVDVRPKPVANDLSFVFMENESKELPILASDYSHPLSYEAKSIIVSGVSNGDLASDGSNVDGAFNCSLATVGMCKTTFIPSPNFRGFPTITYQVEVEDPILKADQPATNGIIASDPKTFYLNIRPIPNATGFLTDVYMLSGATKNIAIGHGTTAAKEGWSYPVSEHASYDVDLDDITRVQDPSPALGSFIEVFDCPTGTRSCDANFTADNTAYGTTNLDYRVVLTDLATAQAISSNLGTITFNIRPKLVISEPSLVANPSLKGVEDVVLNWTLDNGLDKGFVYPTDGAYATALNGMTIEVRNAATGGNGDVASASCASGQCSGLFTPDLGYYGAAAFEYRLILTDSSLPPAEQTQTTDWARANINIYPRPVPNNLHYYTTADEVVQLSIALGATSGYTHPDNDAATSITDISLSNIDSIKGSTFSCTVGTCTTDATLDAGFESPSPNDADAAQVSFKVNVTEPGADPRSAKSKNPANVFVHVYPKAIASPVAADHTNKAVWADQSQVITIDRDAGYTHAWSGTVGDATSWEVSSLVGADEVVGESCTGGSCTVSILSNGSAFGSNAITMTYKVTTEYDQLSTDEVESTEGNISFNVRPFALPPSSQYTLKTLENAPINSLTLGEGDIYRYYVASLIGNVKGIEVKVESDSYMDCTAATCVGESNAKPGTCTSGDCDFPDITPINWRNRTTGPSYFDYRVVVDDQELGERKTEWQQLNLEVVPIPRADNQVFTDGLEGQDYSFNIGLNAGYIHPESEKATQVKIVAMTNVTGYAVNAIIPCDANGDCAMIVSPKGSAFNSYAGQSFFGEGYGYAKVEYRVKVPLEGFEAWSPIVTAEILFRPVPKPVDITINNAIEDTDEDINPCLEDSSSSPCTVGYRFGYSHPEDTKAASFRIASLVGGTNTSGTCNAQGECDLSIVRPNPGSVTADLYFTDTDGVEQLVPTKLDVTFLERPSMHNLTANVVEGEVLVFDFKEGVANGFTHGPGMPPFDILFTNVVGGSLLESDDSPCGTLGASILCVCESTTSCTVKFQPDAWSGPDATPLTASMNARARVNVGIYKEKNGDPLEAKTTSDITITVLPRLEANSRDYPNATPYMGIQGQDLTFTVELGAVSANAGGYTHNVGGGKATAIQIMSESNLTTSCSSSSCPCAADGTCTITVSPLTGGSFATNASLTYKMFDNSFESHTNGTSSIFFYPKPKAVLQNTVIIQDTPSVLTLSQGSGYTHDLSDPASAWARQDAASIGTFTDWECDGSGSCTVNYTPQNGVFSSNSGDTKDFTYKVTTNPAIGPVQSSSIGTYKIEIFPKPVGTAQTYYWIEGEGSPLASSGEEYFVKLSDGAGYTHPRTVEATAVEISDITGGAFAAPSTPLTCSAGVCSGAFNPTHGLVSSSVGNAAITMNFRVGVGSEDYNGILSDAQPYNIVIYPKPVGIPFTANTAQTADPITLKFARTDDLVNGQYAAYSHGWNGNPGTDSNDLQITYDNSKGAFGTPNCNGTLCEVDFTPNSGEIVGDVDFQYRMQTDHGSFSLKAYTAYTSATLAIAPAITINGVDRGEVPQENDGTTVLPTTTVSFNISKGSTTGYETADPSLVPAGFTFTAAKVGNSLASLENKAVIDNNDGTFTIGDAGDNLEIQIQSNTGGTLAADVVATNYKFGYIQLQYSVCTVSTCPAGGVNSQTSTNTSKWVTMHIKPFDIPPELCEKKAGDSIIAYRGIAKTLNLVGIDGVGSCANGVWYKDSNTGDYLHTMEFRDVVGVSIAEVSGSSTCTQTGSTYSCSCELPLGNDCEVTVTGSSNTTVDMKVIPTTQSSILGVPTDGELPLISNVTLKVVDPLAPEPKSFTFLVGGATNPEEDLVPAISLVSGIAFKTVTEIDGSYLPAPDGYEMDIADISDIVFDSDVFSAVNGSCGSGSCSLTPATVDDANGATTIDFKLIANGVTSVTAATISMTIDPVDDDPQSYAQGSTDKTLHRDHKFIRYSNNTTRTEGTFYDPVLGGKQIPIYLTRRDQNPNLFTPAEYHYRTNGYFDVDGDNAVRVEIDGATVTNGTLDSMVGGDPNTAFTCNVSGTCTAYWTPTSTGTGSFNYKVVTDGADGESLQADWSLMSITSYATLDDGGVYDVDANHLPTGSEDPDTTLASFNSIYEDYVIGRGKSKSVILEQGISLGDAYSHGSEWFEYQDMLKATSIEIGTSSNGAPSEPVNLQVDQSSFSCTDGTCIGTVQAENTYPSYPQEGYFYYRITTGENLIDEGFDFEDYRKKTSEWKRVTYKVELNVNGSCEFKPQLPADTTYVSLLQDQSVVVTIGNGLNPGNYYSHTATPGSGEWRPLSSLIITTQNALIENDSCSGGICSFTLVPTGAGDNDLSNDYLPSFENGATTNPGGRVSFSLVAVDDSGCESSLGEFNVPVSPKITTRNLCEFDFLNAPECIRSSEEFALPETATTIEFRKRNTGSSGVETDYAHYTDAWTDYNSYEYETNDNSKATTVRVFNFRARDGGINIDDLLPSPITQILSGATCTGATATALSCEITCDANGDCSADMISGNGYGALVFDFEVKIGSDVNKGIYTRSALSGTSALHGVEFYDRTARREVYIKAKPGNTNLTKNIDPNETIEIKIGLNGGVGEGYDYADAVAFGNNLPIVQTSNVVNGVILSSSLDLTDKVQVIQFKPNQNFTGTASFEYATSVFGVSSTSNGTATITVDAHLSALDLAKTVDRNSSNNSFTFSHGVANEYVDGARSGTTSKAVAIELTNQDGSPVSGSNVTNSGCDLGTGVCTILYSPDAGFTGTTVLKYRVQGTDGSDTSFSNWAELTIDVIQEPQAPSVQNLSLVGSNTEEKLIAISLNNGYTDANADLATTLHVSSIVGGVLSPATTDIACSSGICVVGFTRTAGQYGNATFDFQVTANSDLASNTATVSVDFEPQLLAEAVTAAGVRNASKALSLTEGSGYSFAPGAEVTNLVIESMTNATRAEGNNVSCTSGQCDFSVQLSNDGGATEAVINYTLSIVGGTWDGLSSNQGTITIAISQDDTPPVAHAISETLSSHGSYDVVIDLGAAYIDAEDDKATAVTTSGVVGGGIVNQGCTNGSCTIEFTPTTGYHGAGGFTYFVTANTEDSNVAQVSLDIPTDNSAAFDLAWDGVASINNQCVLVSAGTPTGSISTYGGTMAPDRYSGSITADASGFLATMDDFTTASPFHITWEATNGDTVVLGRYVSLQTSTPSALALPIPSPSSGLRDSMAGQQVRWDGCMGNSCDDSAIAASIATGENFSCSVMANSTVSCWGSNDEGQLGRNDLVDDDTPGSVVMPAAPVIPYYGLQAVTAGKDHACALTATGNVDCWGSNVYGQLGDGNSGGGVYSALGVRVVDASDNALSGIVAIDAGERHTCAVKSNGDLYCWGANSDGQLGTGNTSDSAKATLVQAASSVDFADTHSVSAGKAHTCALKSDTGGNETLMCWGDNSKRQLGYGTDTDTDQVYPVEVIDGDSNPLVSPVQIAVGSEQSCALLATNAVYCWGANDAEQSGVDDGGSNPTVLNPTLLSDVNGGQPAGIVRVALGATHGCAILADQKMTCWGSGANGKLGNDGTADTHEQVLVNSTDLSTNLPGVLALSLGSEHSCAVVQGGQVRCFGSNVNGALGRPIATASLNKASEVVLNSSGGDHLSANQVCTSTYTVVNP